MQPYRRRAAAPSVAGAAAMTVISQAVETCGESPRGRTYIRKSGARATKMKDCMLAAAVHARRGGEAGGFPGQLGEKRILAKRFCCPQTSDIDASRCSWKENEGSTWTRS